MIDPTLVGYRKELQSLSQRLQGLTMSSENVAWFSDADRAFVDKIQREKDRLALELDEAERKGNWDHIKTRFAGSWNKFVMDVEQLLLRVEVEHSEKPKA